jgi:hypothetical protein
MNYFYHSVISSIERRRIDTVESFDEFEEWQLKCAHYLMITSFQGKCKRIAQIIWPELSTVGTSRTDSDSECASAESSQQHFGRLVSVCSSIEGDQPRCESYLCASARETVNSVSSQELMPVTGAKLMFLDVQSPICRRFGHSVTKLCVGGRDYVVVLGGFGVSSVNGRHGRQHEITVLDVHESFADISNRFPESSKSFARMYHSATAVDVDNRIVVVGGRHSPDSPLSANDFILAIDFPTDRLCSIQHVTPLGDVPEPRWRHTATHATINGN